MPSCTRAPPESLMKMNGVPVVADASIMAATLFDWVSPAEPPITVKSWEAMCSGRPKTAPEPVTTPSAGASALSMPKWVVRCLANIPVSKNVSSSTSRLMRSRAVSLPLACCFSILSSPPPNSTLWRASANCSRRCSMVGSLAMISPYYFDVIRLARRERFGCGHQR